METPSWAGRFTPLNDDLAIQFNLVFIGSAAEAARRVKWDEAFRHHNPGGNGKSPTHKIYLRGERTLGGVFFNYASFGDEFSRWGLAELREDFVEWTWMRSPEARAVCGPRPIPREYLTGSNLSEDEITMAELSLWGFGRSNLYKPHAPIHQLLSGSVVDYMPGLEPAHRRPWIFHPVLIKVRPPHGEDYIVEFSSDWGMSVVTMDVAVPDLAHVPTALKLYEFGPTSSERRASRDKHQRDNFEKIAASAVRRNHRNRSRG